MSSKIQKPLLSMFLYYFLSGHKHGLEYKHTCTQVYTCKVALNNGITIRPTDTITIYINMQSFKLYQFVTVNIHVY